MKLSLFLTCVNYSDYLEQTLEYNHKLFDYIFISTSPNDHETIKICSKYNNIHLEITNSFFEENAIFNKGKGLNEILKYINPNRWTVIGDSDCIFPGNIKYEIDRVASKGLENDLFSFYKVSVKNDRQLKRINQKKPEELKISFGSDMGCGYCQIFNSSSKFISSLKYDELCSTPTGSDLLFAYQWPQKNRHLLNGVIYHLGETKTNWVGGTTAWKEDNDTKWISNDKKEHKDIKINEYDKIPAFCINLDKRKDRLMLVDKEFDKIKWPVERWDAVYYYKSPYENLRPAEAACLDSHRQIWQYAIDKNYPFVAIFEDDAMFPSDFKNIYPIALQELPDNWDVWHLHATKARNIPCKAHVLLGTYVVKIQCTMWGSHGYLISNNGCKKALKLPNIPVDHILSRSLSSQGKVYGIRTKNALVFQRGNSDSDIGQLDFWRDQNKAFFR
jgi:hypothetical protein